MDLIQLQKWSYIAELPHHVDPVRQLLRDYSKIPARDVDKHLLQMREKAWQISSFPCIGRWKFLNLLDSRDALYQQVLFRLTLPKSNDALLDLGCCLGQALRQLRADGVCGSRLFGIDINPALIDVGRELFRDSDSLGATFVVGDMIDPDDNRVSQLEGQVTMIQADSFFHLFTWTQQLYIGKRIVSFLKPGTQNAVIFGRQAGKLKRKISPWRDGSPYLHNQDSFQELWNEVGRMTGTRWAVQFEPDGDPLPAFVGVERDTLPVRFTVHQIS